MAREREGAAKVLREQVTFDAVNSDALFIVIPALIAFPARHRPWGGGAGGRGIEHVVCSDCKL